MQLWHLSSTQQPKIAGKLSTVTVKYLVVCCL
jgi:hypothetical protein